MLNDMVFSKDDHQHIQQPQRGDQNKSKLPKLDKRHKKEASKIRKEESMGQVLGFFINQVDAKKYQKKKSNNKTLEQKLLDGFHFDQEDEIVQDDFLNQNEFAEIKGNYDDYGFGDLTITFPNPDHPDHLLALDKAIDFELAEDIFDNSLTVLSDEGLTKSQMVQEKNSFLLAYLSLNKFVEKIDEKKGKHPAKTIEKKKTHHYPQGNKNEKNTYQIYEGKYLKDNKEHQQDKNQPDSNEQQAQIDPIKELLKIKLDVKSQFDEVKKANCGGGFLKEKKIAEDNYDWVCTNGPPKDFLTLVRFTVMAKLCRNGNLHTRSFLSQDASKIFMVIKGNKSVISKQAENMKINKQLEMGYADLLSLEPCDSSFRPLRLKNFIRKYHSDEKVNDRIKQMKENDKNLKSGDFENTEKIEDRARAIYKKVMQWDMIELQAQTIRKQEEVDVYIKEMAKKLNIDLSHEKVELIDDDDDQKVYKEEWEAYYIYMVYIEDSMKNLKSLQEHSDIRQNQAFLLKLIFRKAVGDPNELWYENHPNLLRSITGDVNILKTLWDRLNVPPIPPYADFTKKKIDGPSMWRTYEINEINLRSEFLNMEKIKISHAIVLKNINILKLIKKEMAIDYIPIHDCYQLAGIKKAPFFKPLHDGGLMNKIVLNESQKILQEQFKKMGDEAEPTDFDEECVMVESKFTPKIPWQIPIACMRDYFGEKIAMYFAFLQYYTKQLWYMALIAIIAQAMINEAEKEVRSGMIIIFSMIIIMWSTFFIEFWKREQVIFSVQYGQMGFEEDEAERPAFEGQYVRSITNDDLNEEFYSPFRRQMKILFSLGVSILIIMCVISCVLGIFYLKDYMNRCNCVENPLVIQQVPGLLNSLQINVFNAIYQTLGEKFNNYENHKILTSYENSLVAKNFIFQFVNTFNSFFIISYMSSSFSTLNLCLVPNSTIVDCFLVLQNQMTTIFLVTFAKNVPELVGPFVASIIKANKKVMDEKPVKHPFNKIDEYIENQLELDPYTTNEEVDGTVGDYMELIIQFSFLALFGLAFPLAFMIAFFTNVAEIQVDKLKLVMFSRRPFPQGAANIGNWLVILEVITFFGIFSNAGLIVYTSGAIKEQQIVTFSVILVTFLAIKYFIRFIIPDQPETASILLKRHQYVSDRVIKVEDNDIFIKGFEKSNSKNLKPVRVNINIGGVNYNEKAKNKREMDDDLNNLMMDD